MSKTKKTSTKITCWHGSLTDYAEVLTFHQARRRWIRISPRLITFSITVQHVHRRRPPSSILFNSLAGRTVYHKAMHIISNSKAKFLPQFSFAKSQRIAMKSTLSSQLQNEISHKAIDRLARQLPLISQHSAHDGNKSPIDNQKKQVDRKLRRPSYSRSTALSATRTHRHGNTKIVDFYICARHHYYSKAPACKTSQTSDAFGLFLK